MAIHPRGNGSDISAQDWQKLKAALKGRLIVKGADSEEEYQPYVRRWNEAFTSEAVRMNATFASPPSPSSASLSYSSMIE